MRKLLLGLAVLTLACGKQPEAQKKSASAKATRDKPENVLFWTDKGDTEVPASYRIYFGPAAKVTCNIDGKPVPCSLSGEVRIDVVTPEHVYVVRDPEVK